MGMKEDEQIEMLKSNISRFDHYYASVNFKSSFLVIGNITIIGFLWSSTMMFKNGVLFGIIVTITLMSLICVLLAIKPYLQSDENKKSLVFFNDIANE